MVAISFLLAVLASISLFVIPSYKEETEDSSLRAPSIRYRTLLSVNGPKVFFILAVPVVISGVPLVFRARIVRVVSAVLLASSVLIGAASVGLFYIPSAVMMFLAALDKNR